MYDPKGNGKDKAVDAVQFVEAEPPTHLRGIVHRYLKLRTETPLVQDYRFHALPDACVYIVFDQEETSIAGISKLRAMSEEFNLGRTFHYVNVRFLPGVWQTEREGLSHGMVDQPYRGSLPLREINGRLQGLSFEAQQDVLSKLVEDLIADEFLSPNPIMEALFQHLDEIHSVADMAAISGLSARQLQRRLKLSTGFAPHDLLKILRLQQSLNGEDTWSYADQSHFIHSFRKATGYTPGKYKNKFDV